MSCNFTTEFITLCPSCFVLSIDILCRSFLFLAAPAEVGSEEEDVNCSRLIFKEDFLSDQQFGDKQPASIITEKVHFGEGMHRRAFRTKLQVGQIPLLLPGHSCVLKVHNSISYGTKSNDELVQKNFSLAVEVRTSQDSDVGPSQLKVQLHYVHKRPFLPQNYRMKLNNLNILITQLQYCYHINLQHVGLFFF